MQSNKPITYGAADISAKKLDVAIERAGRVTERQFDNDPGGWKQIVKWLGPRARVCVEATGVYHLGFALALDRAGIEVMVINPRVIKNYAEARHQRSKTDRVDARTILDYLLRMEFVRWTPPAPELIELRSVSRRIQSLIDDLSMERSRLHAARIANESRTVIRDIRSKITRENKRIDKLEANAMKLVCSSAQLHEAFCCLVSIPGVAKRTAITLLSELAVLDPEMTVRQVVAQAGLDPRRIESGTLVKPTRVSRQGNARLRRALFMPALTLLRMDPLARAFVQKLIDRGKHKMQAIVALMRKMLHAAWILIRRYVRFDASLLFPVESGAHGCAAAKAPALAVAAIQPQRETAHPKGRSNAEQREALEPSRAKAPCAS